RQPVGIPVCPDIDSAHDAGDATSNADHSQNLIAGSRRVLLLEFHADDRSVRFKAFTVAYTTPIHGGAGGPRLGDPYRLLRRRSLWPAQADAKPGAKSVNQNLCAAE